ncbi:iron chelate uptake ABC transporter family permease subunit, partial [Bacillus sp. SIMBA_008]|uniref:iron chelate uptake ABC transporter family permease subunit n=1 Tax=Bacillus sp. SIMBA_008 TaxID=3085757 RepID=UPI00397CCD9A
MRLKPRASVVVAILVAALLLVAVVTLALSVGDRATNPVDLVRALAGLGEENVVYAVREVRLPRVVIAVVVGAAFGIAGGI